MKRSILACLLFLLPMLPAGAQQVIYANLGEVQKNQGDTLSTLRVEKRTKNQLMLMGGADYRITVNDNPSLCRYLKSRCYAVRVDTALYVNCRKMRYKRYRFGNWYAPAIEVKGRIYFAAQPVGQAATSTTAPTHTNRLGGEVGDAINASALIHVRVFYEINPETGRAVFVGKEKMGELLAEHPDWQEAFVRENSEEAEVIGRYLRRLRDVE